MADVYGADDTWPDIGKAHWRKPLEQARAAGWTLTHIGAPHRLATAHCPAGEHSFMVDSTADGSSFWAAEASKKITQRCRHGRVSGAGKVASRKERSAALLARVDDLLDLVERGVQDLEAVEGAWALVAELEGRVQQLMMQLDTASLTLAEALGVDVEGLAEDLEAAEERLDVELAAAVDLEDPPAVVALEGSLAEADVAVGEVEAVARALRNRPSLAADLVQQSSRDRERLGDLRRRLGAAQERPPAADG
jgi:hypothetical protein